MSNVTLTIDGKQITVPEGTTVIQAAEKLGINIPALCYDPELSLSGSCRMCVVEIEGMNNLPTSCTTVVREGMNVKTKSAAVVESRKMILELLIADHPLDCMTCQKNGNCLLQQYAYEYDVKEISFQGIRHDYPIETDNPFIVRDMNKCINCGKCVRVCSEIQGRDVLNFAYRGFDTKITVDLDLTLAESDCIFCGSCVAVCPTGALLEKNMIGKGRSYEVKKVKTTCSFCAVGCNFDLNVKDGKVIGVTSNPTSAVNGKHLCVKGRFGHDYIHNPNRLTTPLIKKNGEFVEATWDEALNLVAEKFSEIKKEYGNESIGVLSSARCTNEENYLMQKFVRAVIGNNNIDHCART
ncbi:NADH dehydrogenase [Vulcanibacillus modesticaldus]|uniref:NADH dehydrogenase n=2 Tax=Vulcanibacillus modesticaldus TaxID=337097 RepID=A0A1D2YX00_9BACI|nr:NADH dehydrogenase [Vulcanibacillus modesticaldus]